MPGRAFYLLTYDVPDDKRRLRIAKALEALGDRVQYSVFELFLTHEELERLMKKAARILDEEEDSLRVYMLCETCRQKVQVVGQGRVSEPPHLQIL